MTQADLQQVKLRFGIIGRSPKLDHALRIAIQVAATDMTVLITGESGTGKESFSKVIHTLSPRKHGTFIAVNCGAIPEGTIDSELFGHEKGSFTGAHEDRKGYFEATHKGTIFLDEVGEMPLGTQARLLRMLGNQEFIKVGSSKVQHSDARVVAATNANLYKAVQQKKFREDLYYRLNTVPIYVPALRERREDVPLLFRKFAADIADKYKGRPVMLDEEAKGVLTAYRFPGNIRQLKNFVEQLSVLEMERLISAEVLKKYLPSASETTLPTVIAHKEDEASFSEKEILYKVLFDMRRDVTELKRLVMHLHGEKNDKVFQEYAHLFERERKSYPMLVEKSSATVPAPSIQAREIGAEEGVENLALEDVEKDFIRKALQKHHNKRKRAAEDLGISERTLYRKIKHYAIKI